MKKLFESWNKFVNEAYDAPTESEIYAKMNSVSQDMVAGMKLQGWPLNPKVKLVIQKVQNGTAKTGPKLAGNILQAAQGLCVGVDDEGAPDASSKSIENCFPPSEGEDPTLWTGFTKEDFADAFIWLFPEHATLHGEGINAIKRNMMSNPSFKAPADWVKTIARGENPADPAFDCQPNAKGGYTCPDGM